MHWTNPLQPEDRFKFPLSGGMSDAGLACFFSLELWNSNPAVFKDMRDSTRVLQISAVLTVFSRTAIYTMFKHS